MTNRLLGACASAILLGFLVLAPLVSDAATLSERLSGRILLQIQEKGKAWYIDPASGTRAYLGRPSDAFRIMRELGLGITTANLEKISSSDDSDPGDTKLARRLAGKILLRVQAAGEAWYINPVDLKRYYLGRPSDAFSVMRTLGLGVSNTDIGKIPTADKYTDPEQSVVTPAQAAQAETGTGSGTQAKGSGTNSRVREIEPDPSAKLSQTPIEPDPNAKLSQTPQDLSAYAGSYRCWSYNVSGGGGGDCRLFAPIVLNKDGTYAVSSEKGTFTITGDTIVLSESKLRGPGKLIGGTQIRFEYDYNNWHHTITYLKEGGTSSSATSGASEVPVQVILQYPAKDSALNGIVTVELVPEGQDVKTASYKPTAIAVWDGDKRVAASFHKATNTPQTGKKYTVTTNTGFASTAVGTLDLTNAKEELTVTINVTTGEIKQSAVERPEGPEIVVEIDLVYPGRDNSLGSIQFVTLVPEGGDPATAVYKPMALAVWDGDKTVVGSFHKATNQVKTKAKYDVYADWGAFGGYIKSGTLDLSTTTSGPVTKKIQTTISGTSSSSSSSSSSSQQQTSSSSSSSTSSTTPRTYIALNLTLQYAAGDSSLHNVTKVLLRSQEKIPAYEGSTTLLYEEKEALAGYGAASQQLIASFNYVLAGFAYDVFVTSYTIGEKKVGTLDLRGATQDMTKTLSVQ